MKRNPELEALLQEVYAAPHDDAPRLRYADALKKKKEPLGEFIAMQVARAKSKKRAAPAERKLFDPTFWPTHPVSRANGGAVEYEHVVRGFPAVFRPSVLVSTDASPEATEQRRALRPLAADAGWATVSEFRVPLADGKELEAILRGHTFPSLEVLEGINTRMLVALGSSELGAHTLSIWDDHSTAPKPIRGLRQVRSLTWYHLSHEPYLTRTEPCMDEALDRLEKFGLLPRLEALTLGNYAMRDCVVQLFAIGKKYPTLQTLELGDSLSNLKRSGDQLSLRLQGKHLACALEVLSARPELTDGTIRKLDQAFPKWDPTSKAERLRLGAQFVEVQKRLGAR